MSDKPANVLVVGATGSIGRLVVDEAVRKGHTVPALVRDPRKAHQLLPEVQVPSTAAPSVSGRVRSPATRTLNKYERLVFVGTRARNSPAALCRTS